MLGEITAALARGDRVELRGFGAFSVKHRPARTGRNPRTGAHVSVDQKSVPFFKTGKEMRERLNKLELLHPRASASVRDACASPESIAARLSDLSGRGYNRIVFMDSGPRLLGRNDREARHDPQDRHGAHPSSRSRSLIVMFAVANRAPVTIALDPFGGEPPMFTVAMPLFLVLLVALIAGVIVGGAAAWSRQRKWRRRARRLAADLKAAQRRDRGTAPPARGSASARRSRSRSRRRSPRSRYPTSRRAA